MTHRLLFACLVCALGFVSSAQAQEVTLAKKQVPQSVLEAFRKAYPKATVKGFSREVDKGTTYFEVESVEGKIHRDLSYTADGSLISIEESMAYGELPEAVRTAVEKEAPKARVTSTERVVKGPVTQYELVVRSGKKRLELVFSPEGTLIGKE